MREEQSEEERLEWWQKERGEGIRVLYLSGVVGDIVGYCIM